MSCQLIAMNWIFRADFVLTVEATLLCGKKTSKCEDLDMNVNSRYLNRTLPNRLTIIMRFSIDFVCRQVICCDVKVLQVFGVFRHCNFRALKDVCLFRQFIRTKAPEYRKSLIRAACGICSFVSVFICDLTTVPSF